MKVKNIWRIIVGILIGFAAGEYLDRYWRGVRSAYNFLKVYWPIIFLFSAAIILVILFKRKGKDEKETKEE